MKPHRFICDFNSSKFIKIFDPELVSQFKNVLRLKVGETIILNNGRGEDALCIIRDIKDYVEVEILEISKNENEPRKEVVLYCSILKKENFELVVQKATEMGVKRIIPIICRRTVKLNLRQGRLEKIIKESAEQSGRGIVPILESPKKFDDVIQEVEGGILFDKSGENILDSTDLSENVFVGPEGGWDNDEIKKIEILKKFKIISLGKLMLRAETAAIIGSYLVIHK